MKKILFVSAFDYPTRYAHARHGLEMARAYHALFGADFLFLVNTAVEGLPIPFVRLFGPFGRRIKKLRLRRVLIPIRLFLYFMFRPTSRVVITSDPAFFAVLGFQKRLFGFQLVVECHGPLTSSQEHALNRVDLAVFTTTWLRDRYATHTNLRSLVVPNAVDLDAFLEIQEDVESLRAKHQLPSQIFIIGYIGRFEPLNVDKGLRFLIDALDLLPDVHLLLLGGAKHEISAYQEYAHEKGLESRVHIRGHVSADIVPEYAKACDLLAYVPADATNFFEHETSPMKLFEYMAAKRAIIVSDTPALREVLDETSAFFIQPGSTDDFVRAVEAARANGASGRVEAAFAKVKENTWKHRATRIAEALGGML